MEKDYIPFGDEWKAEMKKWNKDMLISLLREKLIELQKLKYPGCEPLEKH